MSPAVSPPTHAPDTTLGPIRKHKYPTPRLRLRLDDLSHEGSKVFLAHVQALEDFQDQVQNVLNLLYDPTATRPGTRSVTLVLRAFEGVAYTTGIDLDDDHKEVHLNLNYVRPLSDPRQEILGVLCHEAVHCFQWSAQGCPGGLIEGIADWVRLRAGLAAKHWKKEADGRWDQGYQHTGFFLDYLERRFGSGTVRKINAQLRSGKYDEDKLFPTCCGGCKVEELWDAYRKDLKSREGPPEGDPEHKEPIPTHPAKVL